MTWRDLLDVFSVAVLFYYLYGLVAETRALNLVRGLVVYVLVWFLADSLGLRALAWLLGNAATLGVFALIVVFQPELRGVLERLGRGRLAAGPLRTHEVEELVRAAERMAARRLGALIAIERRTPLGEYAETGEFLDARISARVLETVFTVGTPLHDGGVIVRGARILAAACVYAVRFECSDGCEVPRLGFIEIHRRTAKHFVTPHSKTTVTAAVGLVLSGRRIYSEAGCEVRSRSIPTEVDWLNIQVC